MHLFLVTLNEESGSLTSHPTETSCAGVFTDLPDHQVFSDQRLLHGAGWIFPSPSIWVLGNLAKVLVFCFVSLSCLDTEAPFLSLLGSASTDASWPPGSVNPIQPALGELCQGSILLGIAVNPHGSLPLDVYTATLPLLQFPQPGFFHWTKPHQKRPGTKHRPRRKAIHKAVRCFPLCPWHSYDHFINEEAGAHRGEVTQLGRYETSTQTQAVWPQSLCSFQCTQNPLIVILVDFFLSFLPSIPAPQSMLGFLLPYFLLLYRGVNSGSVVVRGLCNHEVLLLGRKQRWWNPSRWWNPGQPHIH